MCAPPPRSCIWEKNPAHIAVHGTTFLSFSFPSLAFWRPFVLLPCVSGSARGTSTMLLLGLSGNCATPARLTEAPFGIAVLLYPPFACVLLLVHAGGAPAPALQALRFSFSSCFTSCRTVSGVRRQLCAAPSPRPPPIHAATAAPLATIRQLLQAALPPRELPPSRSGRLRCGLCVSSACCFMRAVFTCIGIIPHSPVKAIKANKH